MKKAKLTKIDELLDAEVPNNIAIGATREGFALKSPKVGEAFTLLKSKGSYFITSEVTEILYKRDNEIQFKTLNSIYKLTYL